MGFFLKPYWPLLIIINRIKPTRSQGGTPLKIWKTPWTFRCPRWLDASLRGGTTDLMSLIRAVSETWFFWWVFQPRPTRAECVCCNMLQDLSFTFFWGGSICCFLKQQRSWSSPLVFVQGRIKTHKSVDKTASPISHESGVSGPYFWAFYMVKYRRICSLIIIIMINPPK